MIRRVHPYDRRRKHGSFTRLHSQIEPLETRTLLAADVASLFAAVDDLQLVDSAVESASRTPTDGGSTDTSSGREPLGPLGFAPIDGTGNNRQHPDWGSTNSPLLRITTVEYEDGMSMPAGEGRASAREISNAVAAQTESKTNDRGLTDMLWIWGQFVDHDLDLTEHGYPLDPFPIEVPMGDDYFDPDSYGDQSIEMYRSVYVAGTGEDYDHPRVQYNQITAYLDGSVVYGSDPERAAALRTFRRGKLSTSPGRLLPFNTDGLANAGGSSDSLFLAGDVRANENVALSAMHTVWVREHNRIASQIRHRARWLPDEAVYQMTRAIVTAELQAITYNEFLPALLGPDAIRPYEGYDRQVNPGISNIFSTAAYRLGHSMLSTELLRLKHNGSPVKAGHLPLASAFFAPSEIVDHGIASILRGAASQAAQEIDTQVVDDVRNFLFGAPGAGGFDLVSLNIQRGRDHGLADYNQSRVDLGLEPVETFDDITSDVQLQQQLASVYETVDEIDVWAGALAEDHVAGSSVGELTRTVLADQFERIRDGDRFWYQRLFRGRLLKQIHATTLADVIQRNTKVRNLRDNVFMLDSPAPLEAQQQDHARILDRLAASARASTDELQKPDETPPSTDSEPLAPSNKQQLPSVDQRQGSVFSASRIGSVLPGPSLADHASRATDVVLGLFFGGE